MILISACLLGLDCKYDSDNNLNKELLNYLNDKDYIIVCPEQLGGLPTPRNPSEIVCGDGRDVLEGKSKVMSNMKKDVTMQFIKGAKETLKITKLYNVKVAILKSRSPSCGSNKIYDGKFMGKLKHGKGVTTALLEENNILVFSEEKFK